MGLGVWDETLRGGDRQKEAEHCDEGGLRFTVTVGGTGASRLEIAEVHAGCNGRHI